MDGKMISLKRKQEGKGDEKGGSVRAMLGGSQDEYPRDMSISLADGHAEKHFGDDMPGHRAPVKFKGRGYVAETGDDPYSEKKGSARVRVQMTHLAVDHDGDDDEEPGRKSAPKSKALRNSIKRSAKEAGEDLGEEEE